MRALWNHCLKCSKRSSKSTAKFFFYILYDFVYQFQYRPAFTCNDFQSLHELLLLPFAQLIDEQRRALMVCHCSLSYADLGLFILSCKLYERCHRFIFALPNRTIFQLNWWIILTWTIVESGLFAQKVQSQYHGGYAGATDDYWKR